MLYRLRQAVNYGIFEGLTRGLRATRPLPCNPEAACEVTTMLSERDFPLYLAAIKSLLRFYDDVAVVVHSDGTLRPEHVELLRRQVPGCRIVAAAEADARADRELPADGLLRRFRSVDSAWRRLIDTKLWSRTGKRVILDSDVLVLHHPTALAEWIEHGDTPFLLGDFPARSSAGAAGGDHVQAMFQRRLPSLAAALDVPPTFLAGGCAGLHGCRDEVVELPFVERLLAAALDLDLPMRQWGADQCAVIFLLSIRGAALLPTDRCFNFWPPDCLPALDRAEVVHFIGTNRFYRYLYPRLARQVARSLDGG